MRFSLAFLFLFFCSTGLADEEFKVLKCETMLLQEKQLLDFRLLTEESPTARPIMKIAGMHGGMLTVLQKDPGKFSWLSSYSSFPKANQGDPRAAAVSLGSELAYFFGVRDLGNGSITIPDTKEINGAIQKLNQTLVRLGLKPIPISFYDQAPSQHKALAYVKNFIERLQMPFASDGPVQIHDASYHLAALIVPVELLDPVMERYRWAFSFYEYLQKHSSTASKIRIARGQYLEHLVERIDVGLGNLQPFFTHRFRFMNMHMNTRFSVEGAAGEVLDRPWRFFTFGSTTKPGVTSYILKDLGTRSEAPAMIENEWNQLHEEFIAKQEEDSIRKKSYSYSIEDIYNKLMNRRAELDKALNEWQQNNSAEGKR